MTSTLDKLEPYRKSTVTLTSPRSHKSYDMTIDEFARWSCLIQAIDHIDEISPETSN